MSSFLVGVATNEQEYDLARIEALRVFQVEKCDDEKTRAAVARAICDVLDNSSDDDVRNYAAMAAAEYGSELGIRDAIASILNDSEEDSNLRWNAFAAVERFGSSSANVELLGGLQNESEFKESALRVLRSWGAQ